MRGGDGMKFWLGTHMPHWLGDDAFADVPLFVSRRRFLNNGRPRKTLPVATGEWALDSGGYTELSKNGEWSVTPRAYALEVRRFADEIGGLAWAAPMDWMCEPNVVKRTGLSVVEHQKRTVENYLRLRWTLGGVVIPVLQGWEPDDYLRHIDLYAELDCDIHTKPLVAVGSVCRRNQDGAILRVLRPLLELGLPLHAFGVRGAVLRELHRDLASADSMAWSFEARKERSRLDGCQHRGSCGNCARYARRWRRRLLDNTVGQLTMEGVTV